MTCIAAVTDGTQVVMGADSAGVGGWDLTVRADEKVFENGEFLFGFTTSFRMGQLLRYAFTPPKVYDKALMTFMCTEFVNGVRECLKNGGYAKKDNERESAGTFLVGVRGRLFNISDDYQVGESVSKYDACGCGESYAKGAFFATPEMGAEKRVRIALEAAEANSAGVRGPFVIIGGKHDPA